MLFWCTQQLRNAIKWPSSHVIYSELAPCMHEVHIPVYRCPYTSVQAQPRSHAYSGNEASLELNLLQNLLQYRSINCMLTKGLSAWCVCMAMWDIAHMPVFSYFQYSTIYILESFQLQQPRFTQCRHLHFIPRLIDSYQPYSECAIKSGNVASQLKAMSYPLPLECEEQQLNQTSIQLPKMNICRSFIPRPCGRREQPGIDYLYMHGPFLLYG